VAPQAHLTGDWGKGGRKTGPEEEAGPQKFDDTAKENRFQARGKEDLVRRAGIKTVKRKESK